MDIGYYYILYAALRWTVDGIRWKILSVQGKLNYGIEKLRVISSTWAGWKTSKWFDFSEFFIFEVLHHVWCKFINAKSELCKIPEIIFDIIVKYSFNKKKKLTDFLKTFL